MATTWKAPTWRMPNDKNQSKFESYSLDFDGSSYIKIPETHELSPTSAKMSLSAWFNISGGSGDRTIFAIGVYGGYAVDYQLDVDTNNNLSFRVRTTSGSPYYATITGGTTLNTNQWYHACVTWDAANINLYLNGQTDATQVAATTFYYNSSYASLPGIAAQRGGASGTGYINPWVGSLSQICYFDYALSYTQISSLYNSGSPINPMTLKPAPLANYLLGGNASTGGDSTNTLSVPNVAVPDASVFDFDGTNDFVESSSPLNLTNKSFSLETWIKWDGAASRRVFFGHAEANATKKNIHWRIYSNGMLRFDFYNSSIDSSVGAIEANTWHHLSITYDYDTSTCICYKNGQELMQGTIGPYIGSVSNSSTFLGCMNNGAELFPGEMFLFRQYDVVLTPSEVTTLYNSGVPLTETIPQASSLRAWYKLDQSANWEADTAGNWQIPDAVSSYPQSFDFIDGNDTFIDFGANENILDFSGNDYTVSAWVNWDGTGDTNQMIASVKSSGSNIDFALTIEQSSGKISYWNGSTYVQSNSAIPIGSWCMVTIIVKATQKDFFINGVADGTPSQTRVASAAAGTKFLIGKSNYASEFFNGKISNVQIFDTALPATGTDSVETLYNNGVPLTTAIATANLKAWYKLDNTEVFNIPTSAPTSNWYINNNANPTAYNSALKFVNSENDSVDVADSSSLKIQEQITICAWVNLDYYSQYTNIIDKQWDGADRSYVFRVYSRKPQFILANASGSAWTTANSSSILLYNEWYFLSAVYDGSEMKIYINGTLDGTPVSKTDNISPNNSALSIGNASLYTHGWNGMLSNVMLFNTGLSQSDITTLYNNGNPVTDLSSFSSAVSWWKLNNLTTGIQDAIGSNNGTNSGATKVNTFVSTNIGISSSMTEQNLVNNNVSALNGESSGMTSANLVTSTLTRQVPYNSYSLNFDGANDYIDVPTTNSINFTSAFTFSIWFRTTSTASMFTSHGTSSIKYYVAWTGSSNRIRLRIYDSTNASLTVDNFPSQDFDNGNWHHLAFTTDGTTSANKVIIYLNGQELSNKGTLANTGIKSVTGSMKIGALNDGSNTFNGQLSNVSLFDEALTSTEVMKLYNSSVPSNLSSFHPSPIAWWSLGSDSYYNGANYICPDLIGTNNGTSNGMDANALVGNAPNSTANGTSTNMAIGANLTGSAPNSSNNSFSVNMSFDDRETDVPS